MLHTDSTQIAPTIHREAQLNELRGLTPEKIADTLGFEGRQRDLFLLSAARGNGLRMARAISLAKFCGTYDQTLARLNLNTHSIGEYRQRLEQFGQLRFRVRPEAVQQEGATRHFPASFFNLPSLCVHGNVSPECDQIFVMKLPERDMEEVQHHLCHGKPNPVDGSFGTIEFCAFTTGKILISSVTNPTYERLTSPALIERYADWRSQILKAFHYYVQLQGDTRSEVQASSWLLAPSSPTWICIDDPEQSEIMKDFVSHFLTLHDKKCSEEMSARLAERAAQILETQRIAMRDLGYEKHFRILTDKVGPQGPLLGTQEHIVRRSIPRLSRESFLNSDSPLVEIFEPLEPVDVRGAFNQLDELLPPAAYDVALSRGFAPYHPLPSSAIMSPELSLVRSQGEFAPIQICQPHEIHFYGGAKEVAEFTEGRQSKEGQEALSLIGEHFSFISKAVVTGGQRDWWRIPESPSEISTTHLPDQNRHPYIRLISPEKKSVIGFKGAGFCTAEDTDLKLERGGVSGPIQYNFRESDPREGAPPVPPLWGGEIYLDTIREACYTLCVRNLLNELSPQLTSHLPLPLNCGRFLSLPIWREGKTEWLSKQEYGFRYLGENYGIENDLGVYISLESCDVRLRQLQERIFVRKDESIMNSEVAAQEISSALRSLFWWHGESLELVSEKAIAASRPLRVQDLLQYLADEYDANPRRAMRIFDRTAGNIARIVGLVHGAGGHLGGGWRKVHGEKTMGIAWGGPLGMRNIDITGGLHDFDLPSMFFPWSQKERNSWEDKASQICELRVSQAYDLLYLAEAVHWFEMILKGSRTAFLDTPIDTRIHTNEFNEILLLNDRDVDSVASAIPYWLSVIETGGITEKTVSPGGLLGDEIWGIYYEHLDRGSEIKRERL